jgi:hypothetical protein
VVVGEEVEGEESAGTSGTPRNLEKTRGELFRPPEGGGEQGGLVFWLVSPESRGLRLVLVFPRASVLPLETAIGSCSTSLGFSVCVGGREVGLYLRAQG